MMFNDITIAEQHCFLIGFNINATEMFVTALESRKLRLDVICTKNVFERHEGSVKWMLDTERLYYT